MDHYKSTLAIPPGTVILEQLKIRNMTQKEFAIRMDCSEKHICNIINGKVQLTNDVVSKLELVLGLEKIFWIKLEAYYRDKLAIIDQEIKMDDDIIISKNIPYSDMVNNGWIEKTNKATEKVTFLRKYFEVSTLMSLNNLQIPGIRYRELSNDDRNDFALAVWSQQAKLKARNVETNTINIKKLKKETNNIRSLLTLTPAEFCPKLKKILADCGVALIFLPHLKGSFLHGSAFKDGKHIVLGLTIRGAYSDKFWFSFFHEFYHIIEEHIKDNANSEVNENEADTFARNILLNPTDYEQFIKNHNFSEAEIISFAAKENVFPGIVVGRLQYDKLIGFNKHNNLRKKYILS